MPPSPHRRQVAQAGVATHGFSLAELLIVLVVIAVVTALSIPAITSLQGSYNLDGAAQGVSGQLTLARQTALATSHAVEVRFYLLPAVGNSTSPVYRAMQCFVNGDTATTPMTRPYFFPSTVEVIQTTVSGVDVSSLLTPATSGIALMPAGSPTILANPLPPPFGTNYQYGYFHFRANGQTDLSQGPATWLLTLVLGTAPLAANGLPSNYATLQFNAVTGTTTIYRP